MAGPSHSLSGQLPVWAAGFYYWDILNAKVGKADVVFIKKEQCCVTNYLDKLVTSCMITKIFF